MMACFSFCPLGQVVTPGCSLEFSSLGFVYSGGCPAGVPDATFLSTWYLFVISLTAALVVMIDIFLFKNLTLQKKVCLVGLIMILASAASAACLGSLAIDNGVTEWSPVAFTPLVASAAAILAYIFMQKDHNKLKSVDRIR